MEIQTKSMIPIRSAVVSAVLLSKIEVKLKNLFDEARYQGDYWCHVLHIERLKKRETASHS